MTSTSGRFRCYDDIISYTEQPQEFRAWLRIGRRGKYVIPRRFHLTKKRVAILRRRFRKEERMPNPFNRGFFHYLLEALIDLGINKPHPMATVMEEVKSRMSDPTTIQPLNGTTAWDRWASNMRGGRTLINDWQARFEINVVVLQRLTGFTPYGRKLLEVGTKVMKGKGLVIDVLVSETGEKHLRLNTRSERPVNESKSRAKRHLAPP
jgi:hypothetical protein